MAEKGAAPRGWTDAEKVGLFLQIIAKAGAVPWSDLTLPEGRTVKACQVMLDKEKAKIKKAREAAGEDVDSEQMSSPKKRKAADADGGKSKKGRKGKATDDADNDDDDEITPVKPKKGSRKKKAVKAGVDENADELVKEEDEED
ncbi:hypothetical protein Q7P37_006605 [Cladosporium fusiforme]